MPKVGVMDRPLIFPGEHTLTLVSVEEVEVDNSFRPGEKVQKWVWTFESDQVDEDGQPFIHKEWTKTVYGHPKANLTILLDQLIPGTTQESAKNLDTDTLIGKQFKGMIRLAKDDKGRDRADLAYITPAAAGKGKKAEKKDEIPF